MTAKTPSRVPMTLQGTAGAREGDGTCTRPGRREPAPPYALYSRMVPPYFRLQTTDFRAKSQENAPVRPSMTAMTPSSVPMTLQGTAGAREGDGTCTRPGRCEPAAGWDSAACTAGAPRPRRGRMRVGRRARPSWLLAQVECS
jgi:hypothetical protein